MVEELNKENFLKKIREEIVVVDFFADWCGPCRQIAPVFEDLSKDIKKIKFFKINIEKSRDIASQYGVMSIPCFVVFKDGKEADRIVGGMQKEQLRQRLESFL